MDRPTRATTSTATVRGPLTLVPLHEAESTTQQALLERLESWYAARPWHGREWDRALRRRGQAHLARERLARSLEAGAQAWIAHGPEASAVAGVAVLEPLPWDTAHFGVPMASLSAFTAQGPSAIAILAGAVSVACRASAFAHVRHVADARARAGIEGLQLAGFRHRWSYVRVVCDLEQRLARGEVTAGFPGQLPAGFTLEDAGPEHFDALSEAVGRLEAYNWLQHERALPPEARAAYPHARLRNCLEGQFADRCVLLRHEGALVGFNASALKAHRPPSGDGGSYTLERDTFVVPGTVAGAGAVLATGVQRRLAGEADRLVGRVRLEGTSMQRLLFAAGWHPWGGEHVLAWTP